MHPLTWLGAADGDVEGVSEGTAVGPLDGDAEGASEGDEDGVVVGRTEGACAKRHRQGVRKRA